MRLTSVSVRAFASRFVIALIAGTFLAGGVIRLGNWYEDKKVAEIPKIKFHSGTLGNTGKADDPAKPGNFLIVGNDSRAFVKSSTDAQHFGSATSQTGSRSDTIMIAHIDPAVKVATLLSIPRDTLITIPGCGRQDKINATFNSDYTCGGEHGGAQMLAETIKSNFGITINHYLEVNFVGFARIVDVVGHISLYFPTPARDKESGLAVNTGGCQQLDGIMALNYARSRHYEWKSYTTGRWTEDSRSDFGRIARQQYFIRTLMQTAINAGARDPFKAKDMIDKIVPTLVVDDQFKSSDLNRLANAFHSLDPGAVQMLTLPTRGRVLHGQDVLDPLEPQADQMLAPLRGFSSASPTFDIHTTSIDVQNGGAAAGQAAAALDSFVHNGFQRGTAGNASSPVSTTEIRVTHANLIAGNYVLLLLGGTGKVVEVPSTGGADVVVVIGPDYKGVHGATTTTTAGSRPTTAPSPTTTTTSIPPNPGTPLAGATNVGHQVIGCQ